jgi:MFS transporter, PAT family, solute carrier family 33 (acetyl-CoA transportor), member 1
LNAPVIGDNYCTTKLEQDKCAQIGGKCRVDIDGYYIEVTLCLIYGIIWYKWGKSKINYLQRLPVKDWHVNLNKPKLS